MSKRNSNFISTNTHTHTSTSSDKINTTAFDPADYIDNDEAAAFLLADAMESGHPGVILDALGAVARARGMTDVATSAGLGRESLYKALRRDGSPKFDTVLKVVSALGLQLTVKPADAAAA